MTAGYLVQGVGATQWEAADDVLINNNGTCTINIFSPNYDVITQNIGTTLPGNFYNFGNIVHIQPGFTPVLAPPIYFTEVDIFELLQLGAFGLLTASGPQGSGQFWNNDNTLAIS
jgi:hypothetical protein